MSTALHSTPAARPASIVPGMQRASGTVRVGVRDDNGKTRLVECFQSGAAKVRFPRPVLPGTIEAVLLNTAGGLTGGDDLRYALAVGERARLVATTQAAERIYRRAAGAVSLETKLSVATGGHLDWLPQETIVFDRSALRRSLAADVAATGHLLAAEMIVLGRAAMGETARSVSIADTWRIRRAGVLLFADGLRLDGDTTETLAGASTGGNARALATLVMVSPSAEGHLDAARAALAKWEGEGGVSAWNGMLVARFLAPTGQMLRSGLSALVETLRAAAMPRVWSC